MKHWTAVLGTAAIVVLAGCATGPAYHKPSVDVPASFKNLGAAAPPAVQPQQGWEIASPQEAANRGDWWKIFHDPQLDDLESRVSVSNETILKAVSTLKQARAAVGIARSSYFPQVSAGVAADRSHTSATVIGRAGLAGKTVSDDSVGMTASWEPDVFEKVGHMVDAATARAQASAADLAAVQLSMHADVAVDYFSLRGVDTQLGILREAVTAYEEALDMVQHRFDGGIASEDELAQAQTQLQTARAQLIELGIGRAALQDAIATLCGEPASSFSLPDAANLATPPEIPVGVPSALLERRPDVGAAERRVMASNADIGSAVSAFFPDLMLSATGGFESSGVSNWLTLPSRFWAIGPALLGTVFDGGRRKQQLNSARANYEGAVADYRQVVLTSFQDVEDDLAALNILADEATTLQLAVSSAQRSLTLTTTKYQAGSVGYLDVVQAQTIALNTETTATQIAQRRLTTSVLLVKALGGLWIQPGISRPG